MGQGGRGAGGRVTREWVQGTSPASARRGNVLTDGASGISSFKIGHWVLAAQRKHGIGAMLNSWAVKE